MVIDPMRQGDKEVSVFIFRRDLRADGNAGLECLESLISEVLPIFIFNPRQVDPALNAYHSARAVDFMARCLLELAEALPGLRFFRTETLDDLDVLEAIRDALAGSGRRMAAVHFNADVTPFARERDGRIAAWCAAQQDVACVQCRSEYCLVDPASMPKPYQRFSPFVRRHLEDALVASSPSTVRRRSGIRSLSATSAAVGPLDLEVTKRWIRDTLLLTPERVRASSDARTAGRRGGLAVLERVRSGKYARYGETRDELGDPDGTTRMSAHLKFGSIGVREAFRAVVEAHGADHALARELMWRAFYDQVAYHFPKVLRGQVGTPQNEPQHGKGRPWDSSSTENEKKNKDAFEAWKAARTGAPLVDAGIREMLATGRMHNRARMMTAVYLTRTLGLDWRDGERFFATKLVDYHPPANSGGWQWASGDGADALPPFRTMSERRQAERFDRNGAYRLKWLGIKE